MLWLILTRSGSQDLLWCHLWGRWLSENQSGCGSTKKMHDTSSISWRLARDGRSTWLTHHYQLLKDILQCSLSTKASPWVFTAAAAWAQAYNEQKAVKAALPDNARLVDGKPPPKDFPIWGSILDDVWAIEEDDGDDLGVGHDWLARVAELWAEDGVEEHVKKAVEGVHREEVQGAMINGVEGLGWCQSSKTHIHLGGWASADLATSTVGWSGGPMGWQIEFCIGVSSLC